IMDDLFRSGIERALGYRVLELQDLSYAHPRYIGGTAGIQQYGIRVQMKVEIPPLVSAVQRTRHFFQVGRYLWERQCVALGTLQPIRQRARRRIGIDRIDATADRIVAALHQRQYAWMAWLLEIRQTPAQFRSAFCSLFLQRYQINQR